MRLTNQQRQEKRLLVFNCHEPWVCQLGVLGYPLDIISGLPGHHKRGWDTRFRPIPPLSRLISLEQAKHTSTQYYCIITHNITDLLDIKARPEPRVLMLHLSVEARVTEEKATVDPRRLRHMLRHYLSWMGVHAVAVTESKGLSWGLSTDIVNAGVNAQDFAPHTGERPCALRVCNFMKRRKQFVHWDFHQAAFGDLPVQIIGYNPGIPGAMPSRSWEHLRQLLRTHRFYIHTAQPALEDGYNMATLEAMGAGLPVLGNEHPTSPIQHGKNGFLSDDPQVLHAYAQTLLADRNLAWHMGQEARRTVLERFSQDRFRRAMLQSIETARQKHQQRIQQLAHLCPIPNTLELAV
jgi:hypothetical protein